MTWGTLCSEEGCVGSLHRGSFHRGWVQKSRFFRKQHASSTALPRTTCNNLLLETTPSETTPYASPDGGLSPALRWHGRLLRARTSERTPDFQTKILMNPVWSQRGS